MLHHRSWDQLGWQSLVVSRRRCPSASVDLAHQSPRDGCRGTRTGMRRASVPATSRGLNGESTLEATKVDGYRISGDNARRRSIGRREDTGPLSIDSGAGSAFGGENVNRRRHHLRRRLRRCTLA